MTKRFVFYVFSKTHQSESLLPFSFLEVQAPTNIPPITPPTHPTHLPVPIYPHMHTLAPFLLSSRACVHMDYILPPHPPPRTISPPPTPPFAFFSSVFSSFGTRGVFILQCFSPPTLSAYPTYAFLFCHLLQTPLSALHLLSFSSFPHAHQ